MCLIVTESQCHLQAISVLRQKLSFATQHWLKDSNEVSETGRYLQSTNMELWLFLIQIVFPIYFLPGYFFLE